MTLIKKDIIKCACGNQVPMTIYETVDIELSPELKTQVLNRKINYFKCTHCDFERTLVASFVYKDPKRRLMIWVHPQKEARNDDKIIVSIGCWKEGVYIDHFAVSGYDKLLILLYSIENDEELMCRLMGTKA